MNRNQQIYNPSGLKGAPLHYGAIHWRGVDNTMIILHSTADPDDQRLSVYTYHDYHREQVIWTQLKALDLSGQNFWSQFVRAIEFVDEAAALELAGSPPSGWEETQELVDQLQGLSVPDRTYLVFHHDACPESNPAFHTLLAFLKVPVENLSVILLFDDYVVVGESGLVWSTPLSDPQLQLDCTAVKLYLTGHGVQISDHLAERAYQLTQGWAPVVDMAERLLKKGVPLTADDLDGILLPLFDLIERELMANMDEEVRRAMARLCQKQCFTVPDACEITRLTEAKLRYVCKRIPLLRERPDHDSFAFHPLFYQYLWMQRAK